MQLKYNFLKDTLRLKKNLPSKVNNMAGLHKEHEVANITKI